jgi:acetyl esterase/lipase
VLWIHGGGYITGHPLENVAQTLRIAEIGSERRTTIDVFALQYTLAPEAVMPRQMDQAIAAYRYLVSDMKIDPTRIVVMAASAGAHLALSLLYGLAAAGEACSGKAMLLYPWVNLDNSGRSFEDNQNKDALSKKELDCNVRWLLGPHGRHKFPYLVNFATSAQPNGLTWSKILPPATWITIGSHDVLLSDTERFVAVATADGAAVDFEVAEGLPHGWLGYIDQKAAQRYLDTPPTEDVVSIMPGAEICAKKLLEFAQERNMEI